MSKKVVAFAGLLGACSIVFACGAPEEPAELGQSQQAQQSLERVPNSGFIPYPIKVNGSAVPILHPDGSYQPAWDGTLADLMAADAFALCARESSFGDAYQATGGLNRVGYDLYFEHLVSKMDAVECISSPTTGVEQWLINRASPQCNIDPRSNEPAVIEDFVREQAPPYTSFYAPGQFGITATSAVFEVARRNAGFELEYGDLNLCMAQRLREQLNGGESLYLPTKDHAEIVALIRERAQLAVIWYSLITKVFFTTQTVPTSIDAATHEFLVLIRRWFDSTDDGTKQRIAEDFATAVRLHLQSVHELAGLLQREAATRPVGQSGLDRADRDWGTGQPRIRLLNLLYGGDPLGTVPFGVTPPGRGYGGVSLLTGKVPSYVEAEMRDPRVRSLLGLAREADALLMKIRVESSVNVGFDATASGERLYRQVEVRLRSRACERATPGDPACAPATIEGWLPVLGNFEQYLLWQEHRIEPQHALTLATAFDQAFGGLVDARLPNSPVHGFHLNRGKLHLLGTHALQTIGGSSWAHIDKNFETSAFSGHELLKDFDVSSGVHLPRLIRPNLDPRAQGFSWFGVNGVRSMGAVPALVLASEAVLLSLASTPFLESAAAIFNDVKRAIGDRQVALRRQYTVVSVACPAAPGVAAGAMCDTASPNDTLAVDVVTLSGDLMTRLVRMPVTAQDTVTPHLHTLAKDRLTIGFDGAGRAALDAAPVTTVSTAQNYTGFAAAYQRRTASYTSVAGNRVVLLLRTNTSTSTRQYMALFPALFAGSGFFQWSSFTSFGGSLHATAERAMSVLAGDWSRPAFDPFGLPVDWVPPADASLVGGAPGEPSYQYYLREAKEAAQEATAAVEVAIDSLVNETLQTVDIEAAEERAATISEIETRSLCGPSASCKVPIANWSAPIVNCAVDKNAVSMGADVRALCEQGMEPINSKSPWYFSLAQAVLDAPSSAAPTFAEFRGGRIQSILIRQWNAKRSLELAVSGAGDLAKATAFEIVAAAEALEAAEAEEDAAQAAIDAELAQLESTQEIDALIAEMQNAQVAIDTKLGHAQGILMRECSPSAYRDAVAAGKSFAGANQPDVAIIPDQNADEWWNVKYNEDGRSWSPGPLYAQLDRCVAARDEVRVAQALAAPDKAVLQQKIEALIERRDELTPLQKTALTERRKAAAQTLEAARATEHASEQSAWAQLTAQLTQVHQATGELVASVAELDQARLATENALAVANLERELVVKQADARFGIQRKFRSYDMWRARALLESARRLAVAARRAIEERFVVDLSDVEAPQAFVAAPAIWADEVYARDLDAPSVVGLSPSLEVGDGLYPNQLIDYVDNLERFVQGYTVTYPTSVALPDTEALVIPGPAVTEAIEESGVTDEILSGDALGWTFFCPFDVPTEYGTSSGWFQHPLIGGVPVVQEIAQCSGLPVGQQCVGDGVCIGNPTCHCELGGLYCNLAPPAQRLDELCNGRPPTRARYRFSLDPWGRPNRGIRSIPLEQRHNVRWRRLAVNLVGTGIRDCQRAANPASCFSESFIRYQLEHAGPAWMTNHAQEWRGFDLPTAFIEGGKALASEEWLDPIVNNLNAPFVAAVVRGELMGRPIFGAYDLILELGPEVRLERIEQVQLLVETDYWVRQQ